MLNQRDALGYELNPRQVEANKLLSSPARHILLRGGSRSGKTFLLFRRTVIRAARAPESRHAIFRFRLNHLRMSIWAQTVPVVLRTCFPQLSVRPNKSDLTLTLSNGSEILFGGLDDAERTEKILGQEFATAYLNECSQISYDARNKVMTRLAQRTELPLKAFYDCNPPTVGHWTYRLFEQKVEPRSGEALADPSLYATMMLNPDANRANLAPEYLAFLESLPEKDRRRFLHGEYLAQVDGALWPSLDVFQREREPKEDEAFKALLGRMKRVVVAVDPSGCAGPEDTRSDEIGISVCGLGHDGLGYVLADRSGRYSPDGWGKATLAAFDEFGADRIVAERNFGGAMVESTIQTARRNAPVMMVTASRGKTVRAEPVAALYEQRRVKHVGSYPDLEEQLLNFSAAGYQGPKSPDRADAMIYGLTELMLGEGPPPAPIAAPIAWMR